MSDIMEIPVAITGAGSTSDPVESRRVRDGVGLLVVSLAA
jgi:hypothetical protein